MVSAGTHASMYLVMEKIREVALIVDGWYRIIPDDFSYNDVIKEDIEADLGTVLRSLIKYDKTAVEEFTTHADGGFDYADFHLDWFKDDTKAAGIATDASIYGTSPANDAARVAYAKNRLKSIFRVVYNAAQNFVLEAPKYIEESVNSYQYHQPHMALFITFIQLFRHATDHLNTLTATHLNHYYKEVLKMVEEGEQSDQIHVVFEAKKGVEQHVIAEGTGLNAGKDATGKPVVFETDRELVLNKAEIDSLKTVFVERTAASDKVYAASAANSADGEGSPFTGESKTWAIMGEAQSDKSENEKSMFDNDLGFCIASPQLYLEDGKRTIKFLVKYPGSSSLFHDVTTNPDKKNIEAELRYGINVELTAADKWYKSSLNNVQIINNNAENSALWSDMMEAYTSTEGGKPIGYLLLTIALDVDAPAITGYNDQVHGAGYDTEHPVARFTFNNKARALDNKDDNTKSLAALASTAPLVSKGKITNNAVSPSVLYSSIEQFAYDASLSMPVSVFDATERYANVSTAPAYVEYEGKMYKQLKNSSLPIPSLYPEYWELLENVSDTGVSDYSDSVSYATGDNVKYGGDVYKARVDAYSPLPTDDATAWEFYMDVYINPYRYLEGLIVEELKIKVAVSGKHNLHLHNDQGRIVPGSAFNPFTTIPYAGANFYIGSNEIFRKKIDTISVDVNWEDLPTNDLADYYAEYNSTAYDSIGAAFDSTDHSLTNDDFKAHVSILTNSGWQQVVNNMQLFQLESIIDYEDAVCVYENTVFDTRLTTPGESRDQSCGTTFCPENQDCPPPPTKEVIKPATRWSSIDISEYGRTPNYAPFTNFSASLPGGFLKVTLKHTASLPGFSPFGHSAYSHLSTKAILNANDDSLDCTGITTTPIQGQIMLGHGDNVCIPLPVAPYTPKISTVSVDYESMETISLTDNTVAAYDDRVERLYHVTPFGHREFHPFLDGLTSTLTPHFVNEGNLYIGVKNLELPQQLSVYFQLADATGDTELSAPDVQWSVLTRSGWLDLGVHEIVSDTTNGLVKTGVVLFNLPKSATTDSPLFEGNNHWLRATGLSNTKALNRVVDVKLHAVAATYVNNDNDAARLDAPLAANTVSKLINKDVNVKTVTQAYPSYGGKRAETTEAFTTRISERLRHKDRGITGSDYERMVLSKFGYVDKVKCLQHTRLETVNGSAEYSEVAPGHVMAVVIPDLSNAPLANLLEPRCTIDQLDEIHDYMASNLSPYVTLHVKNPLYEQIRVVGQIGFYKQYDPVVYTDKVNEEIRKFISPWAYDTSVEIDFGGYMHQSMILNRIMELEYVDFVVGFSLEQKDANGNWIQVKEAWACTSRSVLVSAPTHKLSATSDSSVTCPSEPSSTVPSPDASGPSSYPPQAFYTPPTA